MLPLIIGEVSGKRIRGNTKYVPLEGIVGAFDEPTAVSVGVLDHKKPVILSLRQRVNPEL